MNVIITKTFLKDFKSVYKTDLLLGDFCNKLINTKKINLKTPFIKFKFIYTGIAIRGIVIFLINNTLLPIFIVKKSNKKYGNNLILDKELLKIIKEKSEKGFIDLENNNYEDFNI